MKKRPRPRSCRFLGPWKIRSLLDNEGPIETACGRKNNTKYEDRRIDLVVKELNRYNITVGALQETKWFNNAVYQVGRSIVLTSSRPTPNANEQMLRGEGVAIVLSGEAVKAWVASGKNWKAYLSRIVKGVLLKSRSPYRQFHVISCYALTFKSSRSEKDTFYNHLQLALNDIPPYDSYMILGDFNAHVRSRLDKDEEWADVRGPIGIGECNEAGSELLSFACTNEISICNGWFEKKAIHKVIWQHPRSKKWHCIDYAMTRQRDRRLCLDATIKRGAECNTDHHLLRVKWKTQRLKCNKKVKANSIKGFDVSNLCLWGAATIKETPLGRLFMEREQHNRGKVGKLQNVCSQLSTKKPWPPI